MATPQRRTGKTRKRIRRSHMALTAPGMVTCPKCGEMVLSHRVCPNCGNYNGKTVVEKKEEK